MKKRELTVLITGIGGPTPRAIARSLRKFGRHGKYRVIGTDCDHLATGLYERNYVERGYIVPAAGEEGYWEALGTIIAEEKVDLAIVQPEQEVEEWASQRQEDLPCPVLLPPLELVRTVRDKAKMAELLSGTELIPRTVRVDRNNPNIELIDDVIGFPLWIRGCFGSSGFGALRVVDPDMFNSWLSINRNIKHFIASEYLRGRNLACKCLFWEGELVKSACAERINYIMAKASPAGITGNTSYGRLLNSPHIVDVAVKCINELCSIIGIQAHGFLTVDMKEDDEGVPKITEINARHIAFTSVFAAAGANLAEDMAQITLGRHENVTRGMHVFKEEYIFLRDVDCEPIFLRKDELIG